MGKIIDMTESQTDKSKEVTEILRELQTLDKIALAKEDDYVIRALIRGQSRTQILDYLKKKHPDMQFNKNDIDDFCLLYQNILEKEKYDVEKAYVRRLIKSQEGLTNELIDLAVKAKSMANRYDEGKDNTNAIAALRTAADIFMKFAKVQGLANDQPEINVNMQMDKIVTEITTADSDFKKSVLKVLEDKKSEDKPIIEAEIISSEDVENGRREENL